MTKYLFSLGAVLFVLGLGACQRPGYFESATPASSDKALVYLYRPKASNPGKKPLVFSYPDILVDGTSVGVLRYNQYLELELDPGEREFIATGLTQAAKWEPKNVSYNMQLSPGQRYFLRLRVEFDLEQMTLDSMGGKYLIHLHPVAEEDAVYEIRATKRATDG